jgi:tetratricopeptide (TPR) repeat protein
MSTEILNKKIEDAMRLKLGGCLRLSVLERMKWAAENDEDYTEAQFDYWVDCLKAAAGMGEDKIVVAGIYLDIAKILEAAGDKAGAIYYYQSSIDVDPDSVLRKCLQNKIEELSHQYCS